MARAVNLFAWMVGCHFIGRRPRPGSPGGGGPTTTFDTTAVTFDSTALTMDKT